MRTARKQPSFIGIARIDEAAHRVDHARQRLRERRVDRAARLWRRAGEVDVDRRRRRSVTATCTSKRSPCSKPSPSMVKLPWYVPSGSGRSSSRIRRSVPSSHSCVNRASASAPYRSMSSSSRRPMTFTPATSACTSPIALSGVRLLRSMIREHVARGLALRGTRWTGGSMQPFGERVGRQRGEAAGGHAAHVGDVDERAGEEPHVRRRRTPDGTRGCRWRGCRRGTGRSSRTRRRVASCRAGCPR